MAPREDCQLLVTNLSSIDAQALGERLREARTSRGWSLANVADRTGLSRGYVHALEKGKAKRPGAEAVRRLEDVLGPLLLPAEREADIPPGLAELADKRELPPSEVRALANVRIQGRQPQSLERWELIYNVLVTSESMDDSPAQESSTEGRNS